MTPPFEHSGILGLIGLLRNHYLIKPRELRRVEILADRFKTALAKQGTGDNEGIRELLQELGDTTERVIEREIGTGVFEGISLKWFERAVELAESAVAEDDQPRPQVGVVIVREGALVAAAARNQDGRGGHAEQLAVEFCRDPSNLEGATALTTLEPCTRRGSEGRRPCAEILLRSGVQKVLIGLPDPNPDIRGRGDLMLRKNGVSVGYFPSGLARRLWSLNAGFITHHTKDEFLQLFLYKPAGRKGVSH